MNKQPERIDATRTAILDALWKLRQEKMLERISVREVAEFAHVHRSTFYRYFTSVPDAFSALESQLIDKIVECASGIVAKRKGMDFSTLSIELVNALKPYAEALGLLTGSAGDPAFIGKFEVRFKPIFTEAIPLLGDTIKTDYLFQLSLMTILMNISFWNDRKESCALEDVCAMSRSLIEGGIERVLHLRPCLLRRKTPRLTA